MKSIAVFVVFTVKYGQILSSFKIITKGKIHMPSQNLIELQAILKERLLAMRAIEELGFARVVSTTKNNPNLSLVLNFRNDTQLTAFRNHIRTDFICDYNYPGYTCHVTIPETTRFTPATLEPLLDNMRNFTQNLAENPHLIFRTYRALDQNVPTTANAHLVSPLSSQASEVATQVDDMDYLAYPPS